MATFSILGFLGLTGLQSPLSPLSWPHCHNSLWSSDWGASNPFDESFGTGCCVQVQIEEKATSRGSKSVNQLRLSSTANQLDLAPIVIFGCSCAIISLVCTQTRMKRGPQVALVHFFCTKSPFQALLGNHSIPSSSSTPSPILHSSSPLP